MSKSPLLLASRSPQFSQLLAIVTGDEHPLLKSRLFPNVDSRFFSSRLIGTSFGT